MSDYISLPYDFRKLQGWMKEFVPSQGLFDNEEVSEEFCLKVVQRTLAELKKWSDENPRSSMLGTFKRMWDKRPSNLRSWFGADTAHQEEDEEDTSEISGAVNAIQNVAGKKPKKTYKESPLIDIVVFRFPDFEQQCHFVAYHLKLCSWTSVTPNHDPKEGQIVKVGTRGEYHMRRFDVRREFIEEIGEQTKEKALQELTDLLRKCKL